jgi:hypothetical protein
MKLTRGKISKLLNKKKQSKKLYPTKNKNTKNKKTFRIKRNINLSNTSLKNIKYKRSKGGKNINTITTNSIEQTNILEKEPVVNPNNLSKDDVSKSIDTVLDYVTTEIANKINTEFVPENEIAPTTKQEDKGESNREETNAESLPIETPESENIDTMQEVTSEVKRPETEPIQITETQSSEEMPETHPFEELQEIEELQETDPFQEVPEPQTEETQTLEIPETKIQEINELQVLASQNQIKKPKFRLTKKSRAK